MNKLEEQTRGNTISSLKQYKCRPLSGASTPYRVVMDLRDVSIAIDQSTRGQ